MSQKYIIGIDSGASKTKIRAAEPKSNNRIIIEGVTSGGNLNIVSPFEVENNLNNLVKDLLRQSGLLFSDCIGVCTGAAGAGLGANREKFINIIKNIGFSCPIEVVTDIKAALVGALDGEKGIMIISGTGSVCLASDEYGDDVRVGGWGYKIGDEGSGYDIGCVMLSETMRAYDEGWNYVLTPMIMRHFNADNYKNLISAVCNPNISVKDIAALARVCIEIAEETAENIENKEAVREAKDILQSAARSLSRLVLLAYNKKWRNGESIYWSYGGGVLTGSALLRTMVNEILE